MNDTTKRRLRALGLATLFAAGYAILFAAITGVTLLLDAWVLVLAILRAGDPIGHGLDDAYVPFAGFACALLALASWLALGREGRDSVNTEVRRSLRRIVAPFVLECWQCGGLMLRKQTMMLLDNPAGSEWFGAHVPLHSCCLRDEHGRSKAAVKPESPKAPGAGSGAFPTPPVPPGEAKQERRSLDQEMADVHAAYKQAEERVADISDQVRTFRSLGRQDDVETAQGRLDEAKAALAKAHADLQAVIGRRDALDDTAA